jgi:hypothetical protein
MVPAGTAHARCAGETGCPLHGAIASAPDPNSEPKPEERKRKKGTFQIPVDSSQETSGGDRIVIL